jgi:hypothetical protein
MSRRDRFRPPNGIEVPEEGIVPEQPDDPLHYEMEIPPEPKNAESEKDDHVSRKPAGEKSIDTGREEDKERRQPGG